MSRSSFSLPVLCLFVVADYIVYHVFTILTRSYAITSHPVSVE